MIIRDVGREDASKMRFVEDDDVIEALAANRSDDAFNIRILPGTRRRGGRLRDADASDSALERVAVDAIAVSV
jgi:hypothetical protein